MKLLTLTLLAALLCGCDKELKSKLPPYTVVCTSDGKYTATEKDGSINPFACYDSRDRAENYLRWAIEFDKEKSSENEKVTAEKLDAIRKRDWKVCQ